MSEIVRRAEPGSELGPRREPLGWDEGPGDWPFGYGPEEDNPLRLHYRVVASRRWLVLAVLFTVLAVVCVQTFTVTPLYQSTTRIQIDPEVSNVLPYKDFSEPTEGFRASETYVQTQVQILRSRALAERVIRRLNLDQDPAFNADTSPGAVVELLERIQAGARVVLATMASPGPGSPPAPTGTDGTQGDRSRVMIDSIGRFLEALQVTPVRGTRLVEASFTSHSPQFAEKVVNTLTEEYIELHFESRYHATTKATEFLQRQLQDLKITIESAEERLIHYARSRNILNVDEVQNLVLQDLASLSEERSRVRSQLISRTAEHRALQGATVESFPQALGNDTTAALEGRLLALEQNLANLFAQYGSRWPEVLRLQEEIGEVREQLNRERQLAIDRVQLDYQLALDHERMINAALEEQKTLAERLAQDSIQYNILKREVDTSKQLYDGLLQRLKEAGVAAGLQSSNVRVVDRGELPLWAVKPRTQLNLGLGLLSGLIMGIGLAFLLEYLNNTVKTPEEIEHFLGLPSLAVIPTVESLAPVRARRLIGSRSEDGPVPGLIAAEDPRSKVWEAYRSLRTSILLSHSGRPPQRILVTSSLPREGKTTTVANMGIVMAQTGARTILIDVDMRKPFLARKFGLNGAGGMSTYLSGNSDLTSQIQPTAVPNLFVIPAGPQPPNAAELLGSERLQRALQLLEEEFKYVIVDSPPVLSVTDALIVAPETDGVVLVVQGGKTPREAIRKTRGHLLGVGAAILGAMVNNVDLNKSEYAYYYRYYYDDRYYREAG